MILHGYFRSSASWRVRIALALKGYKVDAAFHDLRNGEQRDPAYLALNPQGLVPTLKLDDGQALTQSLAIIEYLDEMRSEPLLLPDDPIGRARVRAFALTIACDIHPVQNLKVLQRVRSLAGEDAGTQWAREVIEDGLAACVRLLPPTQHPYCFSESPGLGDVVLVPQLANARRFGAAVPDRLAAIAERCLRLSAFHQTRPDAQPDAHR